MPRYEQHTMSMWNMVTSVMLRKSISMFKEISWLLNDFASILISAIRFSTLLARHRHPSANHQYYRTHQPFSTMPLPTWKWVFFFKFLAFSFSPIQSSFQFVLVFISFLTCGNVCMINNSQLILHKWIISLLLVHW